ncbi:MAG: winged helix-turn-helix domain-containing protein [Bacteroidales bacterium]|nr:winged helix-turn-helix domain-containing protein [Bacteroidales bacterium]
MSLPETKVTEKVTGNQKKILELLEGNPEISQKEIGELRGISKSHVTKNMVWLQRNGYIRHLGSKRGGLWGIVCQWI